MWTASAAAFALAAFVLASAVTIQGLTPHSQPMQYTRLAAECLGLMAAFAGFGIVLVLREHGNVTAEVGGLALFTGFVVLTGMAVVA